MMFETDEYLGRYTLAAVTPDGDQFVPALYEGISAPNQRNPLEAAVELTAFHTGCASDDATLAVDRAERDAEGLQLVEVRFLQPCGGMLWAAAGCGQAPDRPAGPGRSRCTSTRSARPRGSRAAR